MPARASRVTRADHLQELYELSEERDRLAEELREETRERRDELKRLDLRIHRVRDIIAGRDHVQEEIPGTSVVATKKKAMGGAPPTMKSRTSSDDDLPTKPLTITDEVEGKTYTVPQAPSLSWTKEADGHWIGVASNGLVWSVDKGARGWRWSQGKRASENFDDVIAAKEDAEDDARERGGGEK